MYLPVIDLEQSVASFTFLNQKLENWKLDYKSSPYKEKENKESSVCLLFVSLMTNTERREIKSHMLLL